MHPALQVLHRTGGNSIDATGRYRFEVEFAWPGLGILLRDAGRWQFPTLEATTRVGAQPP